MPTCADCGHDEHFLPCEHLGITYTLLGIRRDPCRCVGLLAAS